MGDVRAEAVAGLMVPVELGELGAGFAEYVPVAMELGAASPAMALLSNMQVSVTGGLVGIPEALARRRSRRRLLLLCVGPWRSRRGRVGALGMRATGSRRLRVDASVPRSALLGGVKGVAVPLA